MHIPGELGFRFDLLFIFLIFPFIGFIIRRKWRLEVAKRDEINRLIDFAAEDTVRVEFESSIGVLGEPVYAKPPVFGTGHRVCAVCFKPSSNRCGGCKSVHYCSGKCQIIHWRQGHKDECHPPLASSEITDEASSFVENALREPYSGDHVSQVENDVLPCHERGERALEEHGFSKPSPFSSHISVKDGDAANGNYSCFEEPDSISSYHETRDSSVLFEVPASSPGNDTHINISSSDDLHNLKPELPNLSSKFDKNDRHMKQIKPLEKKSCMTVDFDGGVSPSGGLEDDILSGKTHSSSVRVSRCVKNYEPSVSIPGFWDGTVDTSRTNKYVPNNNDKPKLVGAGNKKLPGLKRTVQFSSELSIGPTSNLHSQTPVKSSLVNKALPATKCLSSTFSSFSIEDDERRMKSGVVSDTSKDVILPSGSFRTNSVENNKQDTQQSLTTLQDGFSPKQSKDVRLPSSSFRANDLVKKKQDTHKSLATQKDVLSPKQLEDVRLPSCSFRANHLEKNKQGTYQSQAAQKDCFYPKQSDAFSSSVASQSVKACRNTAMPPQGAKFIASDSVGLKPSMLKVLEQFRGPRSSKLSDSVVRNGEKAVFAYDSFVKLYHWKKVEFHPCGLINIGNSCFANVVLQCLAFTPPITAYILQGLHSKACAKTEWCFTCEFEKLFLKAKELRYPQSPLGILSQIQKIGSHLTNGREEDAHEFLRYAIETMQTTCLQEAKVKDYSSLEEETTLVGLTFGGYLRSKIKCTKCRGTSEKQERMMDLTVEIEGDIETLEDALRKFTGTEILDGENKFHCGRCNSYEKAKKKLTILEAPNILTIALKRFKSGKFGKLNKLIRFPEILNLAPYMRGGSDKSPIYRLYGVAVHLDTMNASFTGHYVCYVRNVQNKWFKIDDSTVKPVELDQVLNKGAYMLFYSRCSPRAPKSIRSSIVSSDLSSKIKNPSINASQSNGMISTSRQRDLPAHANHTPDNSGNLGHVRQNEIRPPLVHKTNEVDSSSDSSSIFSNSDEVSTSTDSTRESNSADEFTRFFFGRNALYRPSDSETSSSSSSSSSSPENMKSSPLSDLERYSSALSEESSSVGGVKILNSNSNNSSSSSSSEVRKLINISGSDADAQSLGRANPLDYGKSVVHQRRLSRKKPE